MSASIYALAPFISPIVTRNLTDLIAFTFTPSSKQNVLFDLAVFTKHLSRLFNGSMKISNHSFLATVQE